jgi:hypothetical protein
MRAQFVLGLSAALLALAAPGRAADKEDKIETVYKSLTLTPGKIKEQGPYSPGDKLTISFALKNKTKKDLTPPTTVKSVVGGKPVESRDLGIAQYWIERLGKDPSIPVIKKKNPINAVRGRQYAHSGWTLTAPKTIPAGESFDLLPIRVVDTTDYPKGKYRFYAELKDLKGKVLQSEFVDFELK